MTTKEKFEQIIDTIEELVRVESKDGIFESLGNNEIADKAFSGECFIVQRDRNAVFDFLTGYRVLNYIGFRKLCYACEFLMNHHFSPKTARQLEQIMGMDPKHTGRMMKREFGLTPTEIYGRKIEIPNKLSWDDLACKEKNMISIGEDDMKEKKFGVTKEKFLIAHRAATLQEYYELNDFESDLAFKISSERLYPIEETFEYVYNYVWHGIDENDPDRDENLEKDLLNETVIHLYFDLEYSFNDIVAILLAEREVNHKVELKDADINYVTALGYYSGKWNSGFWDYNPEGCAVESFDDLFEFFNIKFEDNKTVDYIEKFFEFVRERNKEDAAKMVCEMIERMENPNYYDDYADGERNFDEYCDCDDRYDNIMEGDYAYDDSCYEDGEYDPDNPGDYYYMGNGSGDMYGMFDEPYIDEEYVNEKLWFNDITDYYNRIADIEDAEGEEDEFKKTSRKLVKYKNLDIDEAVRVDEESKTDDIFEIIGGGSVYGIIPTQIDV